MRFVTWAGKKYVSVHRINCRYIGQHGGDINHLPYTQHRTHAAALAAANATPRHVIDHAARCVPRR